MMKYAMRVLALAIFACALAGCQYHGDEYFNAPVHEQKVNMTSGFNDESYIWEQFVFPKNKTSGVQ